MTGSEKAPRRATQRSHHEKVEDPIDRLERAARIQAERRPGHGVSARKLREFERWAPLVREAIGRGGEDAAQAAYAFHRCADDYRSWRMAEDSYIARMYEKVEDDRSRGAGARSEKARARDAKRFEDFEQRRAATPGRGVEATRDLMAKTGLRPEVKEKLRGVLGREPTDDREGDRA